MNYDKTIKNLTIILLVFLPIIFNPLGFDLFALPRVIFLYLITSLLILAIFLKATKDGKIEIRYGSINKVFLFFLFFVLFSSIFSSHKYTAFWGYAWDYEGVFSWIAYLVLFYIGYEYFRRENDIKKIFSYLSVPLFLVGAYSILEYFYSLRLMDWAQKQEIKRASSFLGHPSYLGIYCVLLLPLVLSFFVEAKKNRRWPLLLFYGLSFSLGCVALVLSFSRGAWVAVAGMFFLFLILKWSNFRKDKKYFLNKKFLISGAIVIFLLISIIFIKPLNCFFEVVWKRFLSIFNPESSSIKVRFYLYRDSFTLLRDKWIFGIGPDNFPFVITKYFSPLWDVFIFAVADKAHNQILDYWISFGIGGIITYATFVFLFFKNSIKTLFADKENVLLYAVICSVFGYLITVQFHYSTIDLAPIFFILIGIGCGIFAEKGISKEKLFSIKIYKKYLVFLAIIPVIFTVYFGYQKIYADYWFAKGVKEKSLENSIAMVENAISHNHYLANYYFLLNSLWLDLGEKTKNYSCFEKAIDILKIGSSYFKPDYRFYYNLGETYLKIAPYAENDQYVYEEAEKAFLKVSELYPNFADARLKLGVAFGHLGEDKDAISEWEECLRIRNKHPQCSYNLYISYEKLGDNASAKRYYEEYLKYR